MPDAMTNQPSCTVCTYSLMASRSKPSTTMNRLPSTAHVNTKSAETKLYIGAHPRCASSRVRPISVAANPALASSARCEIAAAFGRPVVPLV